MGRKRMVLCSVQAGVVHGSAPCSPGWASLWGALCGDSAPQSRIMNTMEMII